MPAGARLWCRAPLPGQQRRQSVRPRIGPASWMRSAPFAGSDLHDVPGGAPAVDAQCFILFAWAVQTSFRSNRHLVSFLRRSGTSMRHGALRVVTISANWELPAESVRSELLARCENCRLWRTNASEMFWTGEGSQVVSRVEAGEGSAN